MMKAGACDRALEVLATAEAGARHAEIPFIETWCRAVAALVYRQLGEVEAARPGAEAAIRFGRRFDAPLLVYQGCLALGRNEEARRIAEQQSYIAWL